MGEVSWLERPMVLLQSWGRAMISCLKCTDCHRLALACTDSCQELKFIKKVEDVLRQLWYYFHNSPKKTACFLKCHIELKKVSLSHSEKTKNLAIFACKKTKTIVICTYYCKRSNSFKSKLSCLLWNFFLRTRSDDAWPLIELIPYEKQKYQVTFVTKALFTSW